MTLFEYVFCIICCLGMLTILFFSRFVCKLYKLKRDSEISLSERPFGSFFKFQDFVDNILDFLMFIVLVATIITATVMFFNK